MQRTTIDFGIDLGTTNSSIAVIDGIDGKVIPNKAGSGTTPSAVWIDKRGSIHVGQEAKLRALVDDQDNADLEFKLRMGLGAESKKSFARTGREMQPEELSAEVLKSLKMDAQTNLGEELRAAVVTVPAAFENPQTNATQKAAHLAGFTRSPLLLEPVAASLAYGFQSESENVYWLVYDFGGGTFDSAVVRLRDGLIQVVNHDGDNFLGGKLVDWHIVDKTLASVVGSEFNLPDFHRSNPRWKAAFGRLKYHAEMAKIEVCRTKASAEVWVERLCQDEEGQEIDFAYTLTPDDVQEASRPYIERSLDLCRKTLGHLGLAGKDMERILMVGGTTLNPWVRDAVQSELGSQVEFSIDPVTVVARGAAIFAGTQALPYDPKDVRGDTWRIQIEHAPVGNVPDPDIGGRIIPTNGQSLEGFTIEFVDTKTQWRSGRIPLEAGGVFMTRLFAERLRRHEYRIELHDPTTARVATSPQTVSYTLGVTPEDPPAAMTIGIGLADGGVATYVRKGDRLPLRKSMDHYTIVGLQAGNADDVLRIPLLEGEHSRAERNHGIGALTIRGSDIRRNLPVNSQIEITLLMDQSQQVRLQAYVNSLDEDFEVGFDPQMKHNSLAELRREAETQKERLANAREEVDRSRAPRAQTALERMEEQQLLEHVDSLSEAAESDPDAVAELDRRLRELAATIDVVEDSAKWPKLLEEAKESRTDVERVVDDHGEARDRDRLRALKEELQRAIDTEDSDLLRKSIDDLDYLRNEVLSRLPEMHVAFFSYLEDRKKTMRDHSRAERILAQGHRAINNGDIDALKAANRQLTSLLPRDEQRKATHANIGGTWTEV